MISNPHIPPSPTVDDGDEGEKGGEEEKKEDCYLRDCHAARPRTRRNNVPSNFSQFAKSSRIKYGSL